MRAVRPFPTILCLVAMLLGGPGALTLKLDGRGGRNALSEHELRAFHAGWNPIKAVADGAKATAGFLGKNARAIGGLAAVAGGGFLTLVTVAAASAAPWEALAGMTLVTTAAVPVVIAASGIAIAAWGGWLIYRNFKKPASAGNP